MPTRLRRFTGATALVLLQGCLYEYELSHEGPVRLKVGDITEVAVRLAGNPQQGPGPASESATLLGTNVDWIDVASVRTPDFNGYVHFGVDATATPGTFRASVQIRGPNAPAVGTLDVVILGPDALCTRLSASGSGFCTDWTAPGGGVVDVRDTDGGFPDAGEPDAGGPDAGSFDAGEPDAGHLDAGETDAGEFDAGEPDAGAPDAGDFDAGTPDAGQPDPGPDAGPITGNSNVTIEHFRTAWQEPATFAAVRLGEPNAPWQVLAPTGNSYTFTTAVPGQRYGVLLVCALDATGQVDVRQYEADADVLPAIRTGCAIPRTEATTFRNFIYTNTPEGLCGQTWSGTGFPYCGNYTLLADARIDLLHAYLSGTDTGSGVLERLFFTRGATRELALDTIDAANAVEVSDSIVSLAPGATNPAFFFVPSAGNAIGLSPSTSGPGFVDVPAVPASVRLPNDLHWARVGNAGSRADVFTTAGWPGALSPPMLNGTVAQVTSNGGTLEASWQARTGDVVAYRLALRGNANPYLRWSVIHSRRGANDGAGTYSWVLPAVGALAGWNAAWRPAASDTSSWWLDTLAANRPLADILGAGNPFTVVDDLATPQDLVPSSAFDGLRVETATVGGYVAH